MGEILGFLFSRLRVHISAASNAQDFCSHNHLNSKTPPRNHQAIYPDLIENISRLHILEDLLSYLDAHKFPKYPSAIYLPGVKSLEKHYPYDYFLTMHVVHLCSNHPAKPCLTVCTSLCKYAHLETKDMLDMVQDCSACSFGNIQILFHSGSSTSLMLCICI